ncbi:hypothetical protein [Paractinoplanes rishiriensis]|uniref:PH domain-containing protein n=1 Tax=Paractinoplanes rishiriensis TaxID=1050105 RepID=A0A919K1P9_9ACTN|nr:hypothetical protein [Actinoplanes rishiriensis]GIE97420.1 hypothetical protein Ari01nite_48850 [Actinoplanes rishiriensis]
MRLIKKVVRYELIMWGSLLRVLLRLPERLEPGARTFGYARAVAPILIALTVVSAIEVAVVDVVLQHVLPWPTVRYAALGLGVWGVVWMLGIGAILRTHRHVVGPAGLRIRNSTSVDLTLPWSEIELVRAVSRYPDGSGTVQHAGDRVSIAVGSQTAVDVVLREPRTLDLPEGPATGVREVRFQADAPDELVTLAHTYLEACQPTGS